jgi:hypothetical protein
MVPPVAVYRPGTGMNATTATVPMAMMPFIERPNALPPVTKG